MYIENTIDQLKLRYENEPEFLQAVAEVFRAAEPLIKAHPEYEKADLLMRMAEPERMIRFKVVWTDDEAKRRLDSQIF